MSCALLHPDNFPDPLRPRVNERLSEIEREIHRLFRPVEANGEESNYEPQRIHDGIAIDPKHPNKGEAAAEIIDGDGVSAGSNCNDPSETVLVLGDDINDRRMFDVVHERLGDRGIRVIVGKKKDWEPPHQAVADYRAADEIQAHGLLQAILTCRRGEVAPVDPAQRAALHTARR